MCPLCLYKLACITLPPASCCNVNTEATGVLERITHPRKQRNSLVRTRQMFDDLQVKVKKHSAVFNRQLMMKHRSIISKRLKPE